MKHEVRKCRLLARNKAKKSIRLKVLSSQISRVCGINKESCYGIFKILFNLIAKELSNDNKVIIPKFGTFFVDKRIIFSPNKSLKVFVKGVSNVRTRDYRPHEDAEVEEYTKEKWMD